jgi:hypothetical protein
MRQRRGQKGDGTMENGPDYPDSNWTCEGGMKESVTVDSGSRFQASWPQVEILRVRNNERSRGSHWLAGPFDPHVFF